MGHCLWSYSRIILTTSGWTQSGCQNEIRVVIAFAAFYFSLDISGIKKKNKGLDAFQKTISIDL